MGLLSKIGIDSEFKKKLKKIANEFSIYTLKGRSGLLSRFLVLLILASGIWFSNSIINQVGKIDDIKTFRLPFNNDLNQIKFLLAETGHFQKQFLLTGDIKNSENRINIWEGQLEEYVRQLKSHKTNSLLSREVTYNLDTLIQLMPRLQLLQQDYDNAVDQYYQSKKLFEFASGDTANALVNLEELLKIQHKFENLSLRYQNDLSPLLNEINLRISLIKTENQEIVVNGINRFGTDFGNIANQLLWFTIISVIVGLLLSVWVLAQIDTAIKYPLKLIRQLSQGQLPDNIKETKDELNTLNLALKEVSQNLRNASNFAGSIGAGNFEIKYKPASENDALGNALLQMGNQLQEVAEKDKNTNWINNGQTKFAELLRQYNNESEQMAKNVISELVKYLEANQGGLYVINDHNPDDVFLELQSAYAYSRHKHISQTFKPGDGLIGQVYLEGNTLLLKKVPDDYITIKSGIGSANPRSILIVPLKVNDQTHGVIELAAFEVFEQYKIDFVESLAESIASSIANAKINDRTRLLLEESQEQAEEMRAQEEEMRQNMEELQATQEEITRKEMESRSIIDAINATQGYVELSLDREVLFTNDLFAQMVKYTPEELKGKYHQDLVFEEDIKSEAYFNMWQKLREGEQVSGMVRRKSSDGKEVFLQANYSPVKDKNGNVAKIIKVCFDITETKKLESEYKALLNHINRSAFVVDFDKDRYIVNINQKFLDLIQKQAHEVIGKRDDEFDSMAKNDPERFKAFWDGLMKGEVKHKETNFVTPKGNNMWIQETYTPIKDETGQVVRVLNVATDITELKENEKQRIELNEQLKAKQDEIDAKLIQIKSVESEVEHRSEDVSFMLETISEGALLTDESGAMLFATNKMLKLFGLQGDEILGLEIQEFFLNADPENQRGKTELEYAPTDAEPKMLVFDVVQLGNGNIAWLLKKQQ